MAVYYIDLTVLHRPSPAAPEEQLPGKYLFDSSRKTVIEIDEESHLLVKGQGTARYIDALLTNKLGYHTLSKIVHYESRELTGDIGRTLDAEMKRCYLKHGRLREGLEGKIKRALVDAGIISEQVPA